MDANYQSKILTLLIIYLKEKVIKACYNSYEKFIKSKIGVTNMSPLQRKKDKFLITSFHL